MFYSSVAYLQSTDDTSRLDEFRNKGDYEGLLRLAQEYYDGNGINEQYTFTSPLQNKGDDLLVEDKDFAVVYNNSVGSSYEVMLKYSEQEIRDHINRYGIRLASDDIKGVAKDMVAEQFLAMTKQRTPVLRCRAETFSTRDITGKPTRLMSERLPMQVLPSGTVSHTTTILPLSPIFNLSIRN